MNYQEAEHSVCCGGCSRTIEAGEWYYYHEAGMVECPECFHSEDE